MANALSAVMNLEALNGVVKALHNRWQPESATIFLAERYAVDSIAGVATAPITQVEALQQRLGLAVVVAEPDNQCQQHIASLRDQWADIVVVVVPSTRVEGDEAKRQLNDEMRSLGFSRDEESSEALEVFCFDIASYKATPDWFNAKGWANPQHWDKFRW